ncbi:HAMP domain-containing protein [Vallitalea pronyensis]|uniref:histidine kinase n=1 Tax=Vallitalea pronyensis TaxID=1348613 RepID=A0A8J8MPY0_9FIRM|nr:ATP-binding protein [Vallitalea pronyensis]QUI25459.1 HAMP domain-containing protein [Vallitalea pronyensis]
MFKSFVSKFFTLYAALTLLTFICLTSFITYVINGYFISDKSDKLIESGRIINEMYLLEDINSSYFRTAINSMSRAYGSRIWIVTNNGTILMDSESNKLSGITFDTQRPNIQKAIEGHHVTFTGNFYGLFRERMITVIVPIRYNNETMGLIFLHAYYPSITNATNPFFRVTLISLLFSLVVSIMLMYLFSRRITKIFQQMNKTAKSIANGNFESRIMIHSNDEFGELATNLNYMAAELGKLEEMRRGFIANISHDFRSPLTSIKGFVQAILDGTIPPENQDKYLNIVLNESNRLTSLTNDILLLAKLENNGITINRTSFDIHNLIREVIIQFEQKIIDKKMEITILIDEKAVFVDADRQKIQRVLYNMIDNAVKFCGKGDRLTIETTKYKEKINISIKDTGPGIKEEDIKYIFNRFHKADRSRGKDKKGTGLGLSIVKEIINAHGETINVNSQLNKGTEFVFTLTLDKGNKMYR